MKTLVTLSGLLLVVGCGGKGSSPEPSAPESPPAMQEQAQAEQAEPSAEASQAKAELNPDLSKLNPANATEKAPKKYTVKLETAGGDILIDVTRSWAPLGADRFYNLVKLGYYDEVAFFRVISGFMAQTGLHGSPEVNQLWREARIDDDPVKQSNTQGMVSFATAGPGTRTTQFFINFADNSRLDSMGFAPFGKVRDMKPVEALYAGYGEGAPGGRGPDQGRIQSEGNPYLRQTFPELDYIKRATLLK